MSDLRPAEDVARDVIAARKTTHIDGWGVIVDSTPEATAIIEARDAEVALATSREIQRLCDEEFLTIDEAAERFRAEYERQKGEKR